MKSLIFGYMMMVDSMMHDIKEKNKEKCEQLRDEWWETCKLPRKKKKSRRKKILVEYSIFSWNPFQSYNF